MYTLYTCSELRHEGQFELFINFNFKKKNNNKENKRKTREDGSTHHKPLRVLLYMLVRGDGNRHSLLVAVVVVGLDVLGSLQTIGLLRRNGQDGQNQLFLAGADQVHHLLMGGTFHTNAIPGKKGGGMKGDKEGSGFVFSRIYCEYHGDGG